jgi:microcompartment protein CcmK/EutM
VILCRVVGTVVATEKHPTYEGHKVLLCQPLDERGEEKGEAIVAVDRAQAGVGDTVLVMREGNGVRQLLRVQKLPIRSLIVGIVDAVDLEHA